MKRCPQTVAAVLIAGPILTAACEQTTSVPQPAPPTELAVEAGVVMRSGDIRRAARVPLRLLDADFGALLTSGTRQNMKIELLMWNLRRATGGGSATEEDRQRYEMYETFLAQHTVATATTDFDGRATMTAANGEYFLFAVYEFLQNAVVWHVPVQLSGDRTMLVLDNGNMTP